MPALFQAVAQASSSWLDLLLRQSLYASVVFAAVGLLCLLLGRRAPALQYALWSLVFVRLLLPPDLTHPVSAGALASRVLSAASAPLTPSSGETALSASHEPLPGLAATASQPCPLLLGLWCLGVMLYAALCARRYAAYQKLIHAARPVADPRYLALAAAWRERLGVRRPVRLVSSAARVSPFCAGLLSPVLFLPEAVLDEPAMVESVLAHEMAHVARRDNLWLHVQQLLQALYFFHPLVWLSGARLSAERERICDAMVLSYGHLSPRTYGRSLLHVLQLNLECVEAPTLSVHKRRLSMRIRSLTLHGARRRPRSTLAIAATLCLGFFLLPLSGGSAVVGEPVVAVAAAPAAEPPDGTAGDERPGLSNPLPQGRITWGFRKGRNPFTGKVVFHKGIDLAAPEGTPILAPADGLVAVATTHYEPSEAAGTVVMLDHGHDYQTYYAHLGLLRVKEGQRVERGDMLALVGSTGKSTGPHLHFEVRHQGRQLDPADFVADWRQ